MSDIAISRGNAERSPFRLGMVIFLLAAGILGFIALMLGSAYAPQGANFMTGTAHALSNSATGYSGIVRLGRAVGYEVDIAREPSQWSSRKLMVLTPPRGSTPLGDILARRGDLPTLVVLPKWETVGDRDHQGWVDRTGLVDTREPEGVLAPGSKFTAKRTPSGGKPLVSAGWFDNDLGVAAPRPLQTITGGADLHPLLTDGQGNVVIGQIGDKAFYVLADPDLLSNIGMREETQAQAALNILDSLNENGEHGFVFDVTLVGLGRPKSPLRLAFDPPFLAMTLAVFAAFLLAGWQAFARFGPAVRRERAIAFGKAALVDNAAGLFRKAGRQARLGGRYVEAIRERAVIAFGVPSRLRGPAIDAYLDRLSRRDRFSDLAAAVDDANDKTSLVAAARRLHEWQKEKIT